MLGKDLSWRSLPPDPGQWQPAARSRHAAFLLPALQGISNSPDGSGGFTSTAPAGAYHARGGGGFNLVPSLSSVLVMFGGISGEDWHADVSVLLVTQTGGERDMHDLR